MDAGAEFSSPAIAMSKYESYSIFADESGLNDQFLAYGAIFAPSSQVDAIESKLSAFCDLRGAKQREMSWKKCSKREVERYADFAAVFFDLQAMGHQIDFRALVVDQHRNPLKDPEFKCETWEDGFYRFYYQFITGSIRQVAPTAKNFHLVIAETDDQYRHRTEVLGTTVAGGLRQKLGEHFEVADVVRGAPKALRIHQLADVLLGAVTYTLNRADTGSQKALIVERIESRLGRKLADDFLPKTRPFNVWYFTPLGSRRWASGSSGTV
jgi:hypothetical protein